jgi:hypothetical protein
MAASSTCFGQPGPPRTIDPSQGGVSAKPCRRRQSGHLASATGTGDMGDRDRFDRRQKARSHRDDAEAARFVTFAHSRLSQDALRPCPARWQRVTAPRNLSAGPPGKPNDLTVRGLFAVAVVRPRLGELPPLLEQVTAPIRAGKAWRRSTAAVALPTLP